MRYATKLELDFGPSDEKAGLPAGLPKCLNYRPSTANFPLSVVSFTFNLSFSSTGGSPSDGVKYVRVAGFFARLLTPEVFIRSYIVQIFGVCFDSGDKDSIAKDALMESSN